MKRIMLMTAVLLTATVSMGRTLDARMGDWKVKYDRTAHSFTVLKDGRAVLQNVVPEATWEDLDGHVTPVSVKDATAVTRRKARGHAAYAFTVGDVTMEQTFTLDHGALLLQLTLHADRDIRSRYLAPVAVRQRYPLLPPDDGNRMLKVPFDNDDFVRYHKNRFGSTMTSFEAAAFYSGRSRAGLVVGSVDHDHWKSGIQATTSADGAVDTLLVFSGISHKETRDVLPHGALEGRTIASARYFVDFVDDWRDGMEAFAYANTRVVPRRETWTGGTPFGWQSWGVMSSKNSYQCDIAVSDYFHDVLQPGGFCNDQGTIVMSIDAWDNLSPQNKRDLCAHCEANGQIPGTYWTPFCLWWDEARLYRQKLPGQDQYMAYECVLKADGQFIKYDGAYCLDPTHPGVKAWITSEVQRIKDYGFRYLKVDFTDNGIIQADNYHNPAVRTGVEAYNEGFTHFTQEADKGTPLFIALSIAPIFPYQYGNSRRIACDTWGRISHTEYSMNAIGGGWWHSILYQYSDPDHCPLIGVDGDRETTEGENRARVTNLCAAGMLLISDNFDLDDTTGKGDPVLSRQRCPEILFHPEIMAIGRLGRTFRPIYGDREHAHWPWTSENCFQLDTDTCTYVAVINYLPEPLAGTVTAADLGIRHLGTIKELWTATPVAAHDDAFAYEVPGCDARIYRLSR